MLMKNELIEIETATGIEIYNITPQVIDILTLTGINGG